MFLFSRLRKHTGSAQVQTGLLFLSFFFPRKKVFGLFHGLVWVQLSVRLNGVVGGLGQGLTERAFDRNSVSPVPGENGWSIGHRPSQLPGELSQNSLGTSPHLPARWRVGFCAEGTEPSVGCWPLHSADLGCLEMHPPLKSTHDRPAHQHMFGRDPCVMSDMGLRGRICV